MTVAKLDYDKTEIRMHVTSRVEKEKRIVACEKEKETVAFIESLPYQSTFVDIGANVGAYSLLAASLGHWVIAYEPVPANFKRFLENIALNPEFGEKIFACPYPLWWRKEQIYVKTSSSQIGAAEHALHTGAGEWGHPLDETLENIPKPTHIKLDVDGWEMEVLWGAQKTLEDVKAIQVEIDDNNFNSHLVPEFLEARGFRMKFQTRHGESSISNVLFTR